MLNFDPQGMLQQLDKEAARLDKEGRHSDAQGLRVATRGPGLASCAANKLYMEERQQAANRQRAAADVQSLNAGPYAPQPYDTECVCATLTCTPTLSV